MKRLMNEMEMTAVAGTLRYAEGRTWRVRREELETTLTVE